MLCLTTLCLLSVSPSFPYSWIYLLRWIIEVWIALLWDYQHCFKGIQLTLDSGKDPSACGFTHTCQLGIGRVLLPHPISEISLDGLLLGRLTHQTPPPHPTQFACCGWHLRAIQFLLLPLSPLQLILGFPCLHWHYPHQSGSTGAVQSRGGVSSSQQVCLTQFSTLHTPASWPCRSSSVFWLLWGVEQDKGHLCSSPLTDCAIGLFPGTIALNGQMYLVSRKSHLPHIFGRHRLLLCEEESIRLWDPALITKAEWHHDQEPLPSPTYFVCFAKRFCHLN